MKVLSIDTSSNICSISILDDNKILYEDTISDKLTHSESLMPMIKKAFDSLQINLSNIELFVCSKGPGSFTGIRIGVATICAFRDYFNKPAIGISSLEGLAYNINPSENTLVCSLIDAKNDNVYAGLFLYKDSHYSLVGTYMADNINNVLHSLSNTKKIVFVGTGAIIHSDLISKLFPNCELATGTKNDSNSVSIAKSAIYKFKTNSISESDSILPLYLKKSSAEIERKKKLKDN